MPDPTGSVLLQLTQRLRRLYADRDDINHDIRDVFAEAKALGFDGATLRKVMKRQEMPRQERIEADTLLELYETAIEAAREGDEEVTVPDARPDAAALAISLLAAQIVGIEDPEQAAALVDHVITMLDIRAEIAVLRGQEGDRRKLAKQEGFDTNQIGVTIRWFEKCAKHGEDAMRAGEQVFHLYRGTVEQHASTSSARAGGPVSGDPTLQAMFAPKPAKPNRRVAAAEAAAALARASRQAGEEE